MTRLEHERESSVEKGWRVAWIRHGPVVAERIGAMRCHARVQRRTAGREAFLGVVFALNQAHEFCHCVAMKPGRAESMGVRTHPPGRENDKVAQSRPRFIAHACEHCMN